MNGFKPVKRKPNQFKYTPRFYDPQKEERDLRRAELRGSRPEGADDGDYVAGEYLLRQREARQSRRERKRSSGKSLWVMIMAVAVIFLLAYMIMPRLVAAFVGSEPRVDTNVYEEFDPYAPIRIVPNDYNGE